MSTSDETPEPVAGLEDVRGVLNLSEDEADNAVIQAKLGDAVFDIYRHHTVEDFTGEEHRRQAEKKLAALKLAQYVQGARTRQQEMLGSAQRLYEADAVEELRRELIDLLPHPEFLLEQSAKPSASIDVPRVK